MDNITVIESNNYRKYTLKHRPNNNHITFIKNKTVNTTTKREYVTLEVEFNYKIKPYIRSYMEKKGFKINETAYISHIGIKKIYYKKNDPNRRSTFTALYKKNIKKTKKSSRYYNKHNNSYILTKGYGRILMNTVERLLKEEGIKYILLKPSVNALLSYYSQLGYLTDTMDKNNNQKENTNNMNNMYVPENIIMYKEI